MGQKWTEEQIDDLLNQARKNFGTILPLADEILKTSGFLHRMLCFAGKGDGFRFKITRVIFQWKHRTWSRDEEIEVPYDVAWAAFHKARETLDWKCDELKDLLGNKYVASTNIKK